MPSWTEISLALRGLGRLVLCNPDFMRYFNRSGVGALRSFWVALPIYPYYLFQVWPTGDGAAPSGLALYLFWVSMAYVVLWLLPAAIITVVAPAIDRAAEMAGCVTVYNWTSLLTLLLLPLALFDRSGALSNDSHALDTMAMMITMIWEGFMLTHALRLPYWQAGLVAAAKYVAVRWLLLPVFFALAIGA